MRESDIDAVKRAVRERVWDSLDRTGAVAPPTAHGRIPNFIGAERAANRLAELPAWQQADVIKAVPDKAQLPVRALALSDGKLVYMAVPKLAEPEPFYLLDPANLTVLPMEAASSKVAPQVAKRVAIEQLQPIDLVVCGSVAVNREGARIGKGAGYSDLEVALLTEAELIGPDTPIVTTVHDLQVLDGPLPESEHDFRVDVIVTPSEVITCGPARRPPGVLWDHLSQSKIDAIPVLAARQLKRSLP
ncbi:MAG: 5-formyltetrahydrofolate cyclo-ligase [Sciscionella sp.]